MVSGLTPAEILIAARRLAGARPHLAAVAGIVHPDDLWQLCREELDRVRRADQRPDLPVEPQEGHELGPGALPQLGDRRVAGFPGAAEYKRRWRAF